MAPPPEILYVEDTVTDGKMIISLFSLLVILIVLIYFLRYFTLNKDADITISQAEFNLLTNRAKLPEGNLNRDLLTTGDGYVNPNNFTIEDLESLVGLELCPTGECAVDLGTGVKRCPANNNAQVVFNRSFESCSAKFFCTSDELPYAILSSGETDSFGICEDGVVCRCTDTVVCPKFVTASINLRNGNNFTIKNDQYSYYFDQRVKSDDLVSGYESIEIGTNRRNREFCQINPSYSSKMVGGCDFSNTENDILGCFTSNDYFLVGESEFDDSFGGNSFVFSYQNNPNNSYNSLPFQSSLAITADDKRQKGYSFFRNTETGEISFINYNTLEGNIETIGNSQNTLVGNISSFIIDENGSSDPSMDLGLPSNVGTALGNQTSIFKYLNVIFTGCSISSSTESGSVPSNKNMLLCLQTPNQPCQEGFFTYNVEDKEAAEFCRFQNLPLTTSRTNQGDDLFNDLNDPQKYTLSCSNGAGCNGDYNTSFCDNGDCDSIINDYKDQFLPSYDSAAMRNGWTIKKSTTPIAGVITFVFNENNGIILDNGGLLEIDSGDYFSVSQLSYDKLVVQESSLVDPSNTIHLGNVTDLEVGYLVYFKGYKGQITEINTSDNTIVATKLQLTGSDTSIPAYSLISSFNFVATSGDGISYGRFWKDGDGKIFPSKTNTIGKITWTVDQVPETIFIYKQFAYNGLNYNTDQNFTYDPDTDDYSLALEYSQTSQWYYWFTATSLLIPPLSALIVPIIITLQNEDIDISALSRNMINSLVFSSPESDFKKDLTFYYPVWEDNKNRQICIKCKPLLISYVKIDSDKNIKSTQIQFSGKDFTQYMYYPSLTAEINNYSLASRKYIFNFFTDIENDLSTARRIVLSNINPNIPFTSDVGNSYYTDNPYYLLDSDNILRRRVKFILPSEGLLDSSITLSLMKDKLKTNYSETYTLEDRYIPYNYDGSDLPVDGTVSFNLSEWNNIYTNYDTSLDSNFFAGKEYIYKDGKYFIESDVRITKVELLGGKQVITTNSVTSKEFPESLITTGVSGRTILQVYSENDDLSLAFSFGDGEVSVDGIGQGRVTNLELDTAGDNVYDIANLPRIVFDKYRVVE
jgi:hypothetical protein